MEMKLAAFKQLPLKRVIWVLSIGFVLLIILQDLLEANFQNSVFYLSESFLFSSFWWLFIPLLFLQFKVRESRTDHSLIFKSLLVFVPLIIHLLSFPAIIWLGSKLFYEYTYRYQQTFQYTLSAHLYQLVLFYTLPLSFIKQRWVAKTVNSSAPDYESTLLVNEGNKRLSIPVDDILYFTANSPYINIHLQDKTYLHNLSLKSLTEKLDPAQFLRIHKSTIVNMNGVQSYTSRLNGDYDVIVQDGTVLRISRNFAANFKQRHRVGLK